MSKVLLFGKEGMMNYLWPAVIGGVIALIYTIAVHHRSPSERWSWWHSAVSTLVSVLLGISVAFIIFERQQTRLDQDQQNKYLALLTLELSNIQHLLSDDARVNLTTRTGKALSAQIVCMQPLILEQAGKSGLFDETATFMMLDLAGSIHMWNTKTQLLLNFISGALSLETQDAGLEWTLVNLDKSRSGILTGTTLLSKQLGIELKKNITKYY